MSIWPIQFAGVIQLAGLAQYELTVRVAYGGIVTVASMVRHFVVIGLSEICPPGDEAVGISQKQVRMYLHTLFSG
jgi:hypothetical protein